MENERVFHKELNLCKLLFHTHSLDHIPVCKAVYELLNSQDMSSYQDDFIAEFNHNHPDGPLVNLRLKNAIYTEAKFGINIILLPEYSEPVMICVNFNGSIYACHHGFINMEKD